MFRTKVRKKPEPLCLKKKKHKRRRRLQILIFCKRAKKSVSISYNSVYLQLKRKSVYQSGRSV